KENKEFKILSEYVPTPMDERKVREEIKKIIADIGALSKKDFGKVMGLSIKRLKGQAEGDMVKKIVKEELGVI
ncbi:MAG: GatB/YqeY domain-containing protein, partial [bacterium]|nr:GatB/YqeY domain-containing protein [bacterium]